MDVDQIESKQYPVGMRAIMFSISFILTGVFFCHAAAAELAPDVGEELARAHKAWEAGDSLGAQALSAASAGNMEQILESQEKQYKAAEAAFRAALAKDPRHLHALADFGRFSMARRDFVSARMRFEAVLRPDDEKENSQPQPLTKPEKKAEPSGRLKAAFTASEIADILRTLGSLCERSGEVSHALDHYHQAMELNPGDPQNRLSLAIGLCADGRPEEAAEILKPWNKETENKPESSDGPPVKRPAILALGLYTLALALEETGYPEDALQIYRKAQRLADAAGAAENSGVAEHANLAIARLEDMFDAWQAETTARTQENESRKERKLPPLPIPDDRADFAKAAEACDQGLKYKSIALADNTFVSALHQNDNAIEKHPSFETFLAAIEAFKDAIRKSPRCARAHYELALCDTLLGRLGHARQLLEAAALYSPNNLSILNSLGQVLLELGQWEDAAKTFTKVLALDGESGWANYGLARAYGALQMDARQCQAGVDALDRAWQLGVRDRLMFPAQVLVLNDGTEMEARVTEDGDNYVVQSGKKAAAQIPKTQVREVRYNPGLKKMLNDLAERFARGEKPAAVPVYKSSAPPRRKQPNGVPDPWSGSVFGR